MKYFLIFILSILCFCAFAKYGDATVEKVIRVSDGDTFVVDIKDFPDIVGKSISVRIYGIDTPEKNDFRIELKKLAIDAKTYLLIRLSGAKKIELKNMRRDKYFRILADVFIDGKDIGKEMIERGYAKEYYGGKKEW